MKRLLTVTLVLAMAATVSFAQSNVLSRNAVGYVRLNVASNFNLYAFNWTEVGGPENLDVQEIVDTDVLKSGVSAFSGDNLLMWDPNKNGGAGGYIRLFLYESTTDPVWDGSWVDTATGLLATNRVATGQGFWVRHRGTGAVVYVMGEVPSKGTNTVAFKEGFNLFGSGFSADMDVNSEDWSNGNKGLSAFSGDNILIWDVTKNGGLGGYIRLFLYESTTDPVWDGAWIDTGTGLIATNVLRIGEGAWYRNRQSADVVWSQGKPYTWPN
ncbi:MAG: hypothetical protein KJ626_08750 [Verrucomicrobia bacterium]|nr:hypothetical protein [Verrucomicrobiota bacterium]